MNEIKHREDRLRRKLTKDGYRLQKNSRRAEHGGYQIVDVRANGVCAGWADNQRGYGMDLAAAEAWELGPARR